MIHLGSTLPGLPLQWPWRKIRTTENSHTPMLCKETVDEIMHHLGQMKPGTTGISPYQPVHDVVNPQYCSKTLAVTYRSGRHSLEPPAAACACCFWLFFERCTSFCFLRFGGNIRCNLFKGRGDCAQAWESRTWLSASVTRAAFSWLDTRGKNHSSMRGSALFRWYVQPTRSAKLRLSAVSHRGNDSRCSQEMENRLTMQQLHKRL